MTTRESILSTLRRERSKLREHFGVKRVALFGSYARGDQTESSDVDILVEVDPSIGLRFVALADHLESLLGVRTDVVSRGAINLPHWQLIEPELVDVE